MVVRPRILLVHSAVDRISELQAALGSDIETLTAASPSEAWERLASPVNLVAAEERFGVSFLEELSRRAPGAQRAVLLNGGDRLPWIDAIAEGHLFHGVLEHSADAAGQLRSLVVGAITPATPPGCAVEVSTHDGAVLTGPLLRLTTETLAVRIEPGNALAAVLPGVELDRIVVRRRGDVVVDCAAVVRALTPDASGGYEAELALSHPPGAPMPSERVCDPVRRVALIREALRRGALEMRPLERTGAPVTVRGRVDARAEQLVVDPAPAGFQPGMAVRLGLLVGGVHYEFFGAVAAGAAPGAVVVGLPGELVGRRRRRPRIPLQPGHAQATISTALDAASVVRPVLEIAIDGMGLLAERRDLLPIGTRLSAVRVALGDLAIAASGRIVSRREVVEAGGRRVRCGVRFDPLSADDQAALAAAILPLTHPGLELARGLTFDTLWCFLRDCGFLYPEKEEKLRPVLPEIARTLNDVLARPHGPLRTLVFRSGGLLQGHLSAVRAYRRTWVVQHLAARKDGPGKLDAAKALSIGIMDYLEQLPDAEWLRSWFRPQNRFPARTFGRFARLQFDRHRCDVRTYTYLTAPTAAADVPAPPGVTVAPATPADWAELRRHLVAAGQTAVLAAEDLCDAPELVDLEAEYGALGLVRRREALTVRRRGVLRAFALLEVSSLGLNLSELTNAFRVYTVEPDPGALAALVSAARRRYAILGRPLAIGLAEDPDPGAWAAAGFTAAKQYSCWTLHRSLFRRYADFVQRLYEYLPSRGARRST